MPIALAHDIRCRGSARGALFDRTRLELGGKGAPALPEINSSGRPGPSLEQPGRLKRSSLALVVVLLGLGGPVSALACPTYAPPEQRMRASFDAVAIGVIQQPTPDLKDRNKRQGWRATVRITEVVQGRIEGDRYAIRWPRDSAACDAGQPMPQAGEPWVVYLSRHPVTGTIAVQLAYPLEQARQLDPRLAT